MELRAFAEQVLFGSTLEEKLLLSPRVVTDQQAGKAIKGVIEPGRPENLIMSGKESRASFPSLKHIENEYQRGVMLHFLANHELLATELMALVLLKFPDAPKKFRMGVFETLKEEQAHTLMYMRRMRECGVEFGSMPLNDYFWRMVSSMNEPIDFVARLSLTFEQANLDFSYHYAKLFREAGDNATATVLEKVYTDEIEHVGHGLAWFKLWKKQELSDWNAYKTQLQFPLMPSKAKGVVPFNREGRLAAGLDDEFINQLEVEEGSRGRTPNVLFFNPNAEGYAISDKLGRAYTPKKSEIILQQDLEMIPIAWARKDDVVCVKNKPSVSHLNYLKLTGLQLPEWITDVSELKQRKLGKFLPWAKTQDASELLQPYSKLSVFEQDNDEWLDNCHYEAFSKKIGHDVLSIIQPDELSYLCYSIEEVVQVIGGMEGNVLMKAPYASAGRGHRLYLRQEGWVKSVLSWAKNTLIAQGFLVVEPFFERVFDFSAQYDYTQEGECKLFGMTQVINDRSGRYLGSFVSSKWTSGLDEKLAKWLFKEAQVLQLYRYDIPNIAAKVLSDNGYKGVFGVDGFIYKKEGQYHMRSCVEVNARYTMGRVALELLKKSNAKTGMFQILRRSGLKEGITKWLCEVNECYSSPTIKNGTILLNDPSLARDFYVVWHAREKKELIPTI